MESLNCVGNRAELCYGLFYQNLCGIRLGVSENSVVAFSWIPALFATSKVQPWRLHHFRFRFVKAFRLGLVAQSTCKKAPAKSIHFWLPSERIRLLNKEHAHGAGGAVFAV